MWGTELRVSPVGSPDPPHIPKWEVVMLHLVWVNDLRQMISDNSWKDGEKRKASRDEPGGEGRTTEAQNKMEAKEWKWKHQSEKWNMRAACNPSASEAEVHSHHTAEYSLAGDLQRNVLKRPLHLLIPIVFLPWGRRLPFLSFYRPWQRNFNIESLLSSLTHSYKIIALHYLLNF